MKKQELLDRASKIKFFHSFDLPTDEGEVVHIEGIVDHCTEEIATNRYGIPEDLTGKFILDIGCMNGYHSFLASKRGAQVNGIEPNQGDGDNFEGLLLVAEATGGKNTSFSTHNLKDFYEDFKHLGSRYDIVFYFGVLYHVESPLQELRYVAELAKEGGYALIETAIAQNNYGNKPVWELNRGFDNDPTNYWYPSIPGLFAALKDVGFSQAEVIYNDKIRATIKASK